MSTFDYDILTVGGGLGGAALATVMARAGARVLVLEREPKFRDRVRGEFLQPWGVAEAQQLAIADLLRQCGHNVPSIEMGLGRPRDLPSTTPQGVPAIGVNHPEMQEALLKAAIRAGAHVRREVVVTALESGEMSRVQIQQPGGSLETISARLVIAADGRNSAVRKWARFTVTRDPHPFLFAGVLLTGLAAPHDIAYYCFNPATATAAAITYEGADRFRAYLAYPSEGIDRLQGEQALSRFLDYSRRTTRFPEVYDGPLQLIGPLASFSCDEDWVEHPYRDGVALIGDAAATSDPAYGQGLSLTLRDVRTLSEKLLSNNDWETACNRYAAEHHRYFSVIHTSCGWLRQVFQEQGAEADQRRATALPLIAADPTRIPDHIISGPELPIDDNVRSRFLGRTES
jgi:2-polyprenyl-6-methoxyphenol hydroxylase-like FAD-dependent oxidoreductase